MDERECGRVALALVRELLFELAAAGMLTDERIGRITRRASATMDTDDGRALMTETLNDAFPFGSGPQPPATRPDLLPDRPDSADGH